MTYRGIDKKSILFKLTSFVIIIIVTQAVLFAVLIVSGGILSQAKENAYQSFHDKVYNRKDYIQREMKNRWINIDPYITQTSTLLSEAPNTKDFFNSQIPNMINMLRTTQSTGVFIILNEGDVKQTGYPSIYIRDYDPLLNDYTNKDLYFLSGDSELAQKTEIALDKKWSHNLKLNEDNKAFFEKPYSGSSFFFNPQLAGYWTTPFKLKDGDMPIITYSLPLFDKNNNIRGVMGVEVAVNYLIDFLPASDLNMKDSLGYIIGFKNQGDEIIKPIVSVGLLQKKILNLDEPLSLKESDSERNIFKINNSNSEEKIYADVEKISLYSYNSPFEKEEWYLIGMMTENNLLSYVKKIQNILWLSLVSSILIGVTGGIIISYRFSKPIVKLAKQVKESDKNKSINFTETGLLEVDELSKAIEAANAEMKKDINLDPLTGLFNRKAFQWNMEQWMRNKDKNKKSALIMFDLDNLKIINDNYGHKWGDKYILNAVDFLKDISEKDHMLLARRSGDEFVLLLYDFDNKEELKGSIINFYKSMNDKKIIFPDETTDSISISSGIFWIEDTDLSYDDMLHLADEAMYYSKRFNKGSFTEHDDLTNKEFSI